MNAAVGVDIRSTALSGVSQYGSQASFTGSSGATTQINGYAAIPTTAAAAYTCTTMRGFLASETTKGAGSTITNQVGFDCADLTQGGTLITGYRSLVSSGAGKWNIYSSGTASNYFNGDILSHTTTNPATSGQRGVRIWDNTTAGRIDIGKDTTGTVTAVAFYYTGSAQGSITYDDTSTAFNTSSDMRLKDVIGVRPATAHGLGGIKIMDYDWKDGGARAYGPLAQDLHETHPSAVKVGGEDENAEPWMWEKAALVPDLVLGWQDHEARLAALEAKLA